MAKSDSAPLMQLYVRKRIRSCCDLSAPDRIHWDSDAPSKSGVDYTAILSPGKVGQLLFCSFFFYLAQIIKSDLIEGDTDVK